MSVAIVTGSSGLVGSETARFLHAQGMQVVTRSARRTRAKGEVCAGGPL